MSLLSHAVNLLEKDFSITITMKTKTGNSKKS